MNTLPVSSPPVTTMVTPSVERRGSTTSETDRYTRGMGSRIPVCSPAARRRCPGRNTPSIRLKEPAAATVHPANFFQEVFFPTRIRTMPERMAATGGIQPPWPEKAGLASSTPAMVRSPMSSRYLIFWPGWDCRPAARAFGLRPLSVHAPTICCRVPKGQSHPQKKRPRKAVSARVSAPQSSPL